MTKLVKILALALGLGLLATGLTTITGRPAAAGGSAPVDIVAVSVASVPVSGTVDVHNFPATLTGATVPVNFAAGSSVNVTNPLDASSNPTPLAILDAFQPYEDSCAVRGPFSSRFASCNFKTVSAGKRLVIQQIDIALNVDAGLKPVLLKASGHFFTATFMGTGTSGDGFATHQETHLYVAPNQTPGCSVEFSLTSSSQLADFDCQLSGFLVDVP